MVQADGALGRQSKVECQMTSMPSMSSLILINGVEPERYGTKGVARRRGAEGQLAAASRLRERQRLKAMSLVTPAAACALAHSASSLVAPSAMSGWLQLENSM
jgi:hypothetical protein